MRKKFRRVCGLFFVFIIGVNSAFGATPIDRIVAVVNGDIITESDILTAASPLKQLIEEKLILQSATKEGVKVSSMEFERALQEIERQNQFKDRESFRQAVMTSSDLSWESYLSNLKMQLTVMKLIGEQAQDLFVTEAEIKAAYHRDPKVFQSDRVALRQILFPTMPEMSETSIEALEKNANQIALEIKGGGDFDQVRASDSFVSSRAEVADLGYFDKADLTVEIVRLVSHLSIGEYSNVLKTPIGFHIFQVTNKKTTALSEDETRAKISDILFREKREVVSREWLNQIKKEAVIQIK